MKANRYFFTTMICAVSMTAGSQVEIDQPVDLTGADGSRRITHLETPVDGTDAVNKDYVDAAVAALGGGDSFVPAMMSMESSTDLLWSQCVTYCRDLDESGHTDWRVATVGDLVTLLSTEGYTIPQNTSANFAVLLIDRNGGLQSVYPMHRYQFSAGVFINTTSQSSTGRARCVR